jgi:UDP-N-acetylglucosamine transferase subunit ALG13
LGDRFSDGWGVAEGALLMLVPPSTNLDQCFVVFATVGTTSFNDFVRSLCSLPFLIAMTTYHHHHHHHHPSLPDNTSKSCSVDKEPKLELTIQYGTGQCPLKFLPPNILKLSSVPMKNNDDGSGSIILAIPSSVALDETTTTTTTTTMYHHRILVRWYRFIPSLVSEMERSDIILCHAGAGTLLEALEIAAKSSAMTTEGLTCKNKKKIVNAVINSSLMDNHQSELAEELESRGHLLITRDCVSEWTNDDGATKFWNCVGTTKTKPFQLGSRRRADLDHLNTEEYVSGFQTMVDHIMGFNTTKSPCLK